MRAKKAKVKSNPLADMSEKGHLFSKKNKVSVWASQIPYADIPDAYFEETFFKNNTRATNTWTQNYNMRYFRPDDLETNGVEEGVAEIKQVAGACSFSSSFIVALMSKARKKKLTEVSWLIFLYEYEYSVKISGIENDDTTTFLGAFDYQDHVDNVFEVEARAEMERLLNPPEEVATGFSFKKPATSFKKPATPSAATIPESSEASDPVESVKAIVAPRSQKPVSFNKPVSSNRPSSFDKPVSSNKPASFDTAASPLAEVKKPSVKKAAPKTTAPTPESVVSTKAEQDVVAKQPKTTPDSATLPVAADEKWVEKKPVAEVADASVAPVAVADGTEIKKKSTFSFSKPKS